MIIALVETYRNGQPLFVGEAKDFSDAVRQHEASCDIGFGDQTTEEFADTVIAYRVKPDQLEALEAGELDLTHECKQLVSDYVPLLTAEEIASETARIIAEVDAEYENGPGDGAEACINEDAFVDYQMEGSTGDECGNSEQLREAVEEALRYLYDFDRHGHGYHLDDAEDSLIKGIGKGVEIEFERCGVDLMDGTATTMFTATREDCDESVKGEITTDSSGYLTIYVENEKWHDIGSAADSIDENFAANMEEEEVEENEEEDEEALAP